MTDPAQDRDTDPEIVALPVPVRHRSNAAFWLLLAAVVVALVPLVIAVVSR